MPRKDEAIYAYVLTHRDVGDRSVETVAKAVGMDVHDVRIIVYESRRLTMYAPCLGWHIVDVIGSQAVDSAPVI